MEESKTTSSSAAPALPVNANAHPPAINHHHHHHDDSDVHKRAHVTWDEETIAEHDLLRGTRQKIEEPNTPYHYYGSDNEDDSHACTAGDKEPVSPARSMSGKEGPPALEWDELRSKLQGVQDTKKSEWDSSDDESERSGHSRFAARDEEGKKVEKDPKFTEKRKSHYNEFERVKLWRQSHPDDDDEDEDDNEEKAEAKGQ